MPGNADLSCSECREYVCHPCGDSEDPDLQELIDTEAPSRCITMDSFKAYANVVCMMAGTGILQLPFTVHQGGWFVVILIAVIAVMATSTGKLVIRCLYDDESCSMVGRRRTYPDIGDAAFGAVGRGAVHVFQKGTLLGVASLFLILAGDFLADGFGTHVSLTAQEWILVVGGVVALPTVILPTVSELAFMSAFGSFCTAAVVLAVVVVGALDSTPAVGATHRTVNLSELPTAFSAITLSFGGHSTFPTLQEGMARKGYRVSAFNRVLDASFGTLALMYLPVAVVGYARYGDTVVSPVLNSLPASPLLTVLKFAITLHLIMVTPVIMHVMIHDFEGHFGISPGADYFTLAELPMHLRRMSFRLLLVGTSTAIAYQVPYFEDMMSLVGAVCVAMMVFVLPCVFALKLLPTKRTRSGVARVGWLVSIIMVGVAGGAIGAQQAIGSIRDKLTSHH